LNQNRASGFFDAFSSREPAATSLENAIKARWCPNVGGTGAGGRAMERKLLQVAVAIAGFPGIADVTQRGAVT
jgi:hypothetical protein